MRLGRKSRLVLAFCGSLSLGVLICGFGIHGTALAALKPADVPLPPLRPHDLPATQADEPALRAPAETSGDNDARRAQVLASGEIIAESLPALAGPGACGIAAPLRLDAIVLGDGAKVTIVPPVTMRELLALAVADWVRDDLAPALAKNGDRLARIEGTGAYECRSRNSVAGAKLSEHAIGNALDMHVFVTAKGQRFAVATSSEEADGAPAFLALMKKTACTRFMTVLGPGSDGYHSQHLHVDLEARRSGVYLCEWDLPPATQDAPTKQAKVPPRH